MIKVASTVTAGKTCSIVGCDNALQARGWCRTHYSRWRTHGDPTIAKFKAKSFEEAFAHYSKPSGECIIWTGYCNPDGYGQVRYKGFWVGAHRAVWEHSNGEIPAGLEIDHTCHVRNCVEISHLQLATRQEQMSNLSGPYKSNTSGYKGVSRKGDKFAARTQHKNCRIYLGTYDTPELANAAISTYKESN